MTEAIRIAVLNFVHETVTFLPNDTALDDFVHDGSPARGEALLAWEPRSYKRGVLYVAREHAGVELVGIESPLWPRTGTGSGWITREAYEHFLGRMLAEIEDGGRWHGVYLALHGAMGVRGVARPEANIARRVREVVGRDAFIAGTFDPHGNEDAEFLRQADFAFCAKYFPHYDSRLQGERAARMLIRAIRGDYTPATATVKVPILTATVLQWTGASPWMDLVQRALVWEAREPDLYMNVFFGFPFADVSDVGMTVQAMTNGKPELARKAAEDVATWAWRRREALLKTATVHPIPHGVTLAKEAVARGAWPVVLADHSDRSGSATGVLQQLIAQDLADVLIATIADRAAVEAVVAKGLKAGDPFDMDVGGLADESAGQPVRIKGTIAGVAEIAGRRWVSVAFGRGNVVLISEYLTQVMDPLDLTGPGFSIDQFKVFAIKSRVHFRRGFDDSGFAKTILLVEPEQPFLGTVRLEALPYRHVDISKFYPYNSIPTATSAFLSERRAPSSKGADHADRRRSDSSLECGQAHQPMAPADPRLSQGTCPEGDGRRRCRCRHPHAAHAVGSERERALHGGRAGASRPVRDPRQLPPRQAGEPLAGRHVEAAAGNARMPLHLHRAGAEQVAGGRHRRLAVAGSRAGRPADRDDGGDLSAEGRRGRPAAPTPQADPRSPRSPERGHEPE